MEPAPGPAVDAQSRRSGARARPGRGPDEHALGAVLALEVAGELVELGEHGCPRSTAAAARPAAASPRTPRSIRSRSRRAPRRSRRRSRSRRARRSAARARSSASSRSSLLKTSSRGAAPAPISSSTESTAAIASRRRSLGLGGVDDVDDQVGEHRLLERRLERLDELMRELADEADRVGDQVAPPAVPVGARRRVERVEEPLPHADAGARQRVQQRRLARVRVAGEGDGRERRSRGAALASPRGFAPGARGAGAGSRSGRGPAGGRSRSGSPRAPGPDPAAEALEVGPQARACAPGCTRAGPARPGACPRRCARGRRRCRGSPPCGRSPARRAPPPGCAPGAAPARRRRRRGWRRSGRSAPSARRACPAQVAVRVRARADLDQLAGGRDAGGAQELLQLGERVGVAGGSRQDPDRQRPLACAGVLDACPAVRVVGFGCLALAGSLH